MHSDDEIEWRCKYENNNTFTPNHFACIVLGNIVVINHHKSISTRIETLTFRLSKHYLFIFFW